MANTKLPSRLLDTSAVPALNVTGNLTVDTTTLVVDTINNRVGIGNSSPTADLSVGSTSTSSGNVHLRTTKTAFSITPSNTNAGGILFDLGWVNGGQGPMEFGINSDVKMSIDSSGNVGIGSSPAGKLHVYSGDAGAVTPSPQADDLVVEANTEVGITLMSPDDQSARIRFTSPSTNSGDEGGADIFYRQNINKMSMGTVVSGGKLAFKSGAGVETMILDNGNVGIGNSGTFNGTGTRKIQIETAASTALGPELLIHNAGQGSGAQAAITFGGKRSGNEGYTGSIHTTNNDGLHFGTANATDFSALPTTRMVIDTNGNVGIGNTNPSDRLVVQKDSTNIEPMLVLKNDNTTDDNGVSIDFSGKDTSGNNITYGRITNKYTNHATEKSLLIFQHRNNSGAFTEAMTINHDSYVRTPYQPSDYRQASNTSGINASSGYHRIYFGTALNASLVSMHSAYGGNSANGSKFTAPVAGRYFFSCILRLDGFGGNYAYLDMRINDTTRARHLDSETGSYINRIVTGVVNLAVGDYITFEFISSGDSNVAMDADTHASVHYLG